MSDKIFKRMKSEKKWQLLSILLVSWVIKCFSMQQVMHCQKNDLTLKLDIRDFARI